MQRLENIFLDQEAKRELGEISDRVVSEAVFLISFFVGNTRFATPIDRVREVVEDAAITPLPIYDDAYSGVLNLRGNLIPVLAAGRLLEREELSRVQNGLVSDEKRFVVFETKYKEPFAVAASKVCKIECPESELRDLNEQFSDVIRVEGAPTHLLNFFGSEAHKVLTSSEAKI